jgi:putative serine protease PepD
MSEQTRTLPPYSPTFPPAPDAPTTTLPGYGAQDPWRAPDPHGTPPGSTPPPGRHDDERAPRPRRGVALLSAVALAAGLVGGGAGAALTASLDDSNPSSASNGPTTGTSLDSSGTSTDTTAPDGSVEAVAAQVLPSVVSIEVATSQGGGEGSGIVLSSDGLILTNNHVVADAANGGQITVTTNDGTTADATIVGRDPVTDLAVIRAHGVSGLKKASLGSSADVDPGEQVVAIGSPLGLQGTVTSGIISALNRPVRTGDASGTESVSTVIDALQTDAAINPGNSGGPLVNLKGEVIGINSAIASLGSSLGGQSGSIGLGFAIPIDQARRIATQLIETGSATHAQLGVSVRDASTTGSQVFSDGAAVGQVTAGGAAEKAGLQDGDIITKVGSRPVDSADALIAAIRSHQPGDRVTLTYVRSGSTKTVTVTLGSDAASS